MKATSYAASSKSSLAQHALVATLGGKAQNITFALDYLLDHGVPAQRVCALHLAPSDSRLAHALNQLRRTFETHLRYEMGVKPSTVDAHKTKIFSLCRNMWGLDKGEPKHHSFLQQRFGAVIQGLKGNMTIPTDKKVDHLILLVGGNPLPNYVAARVLCRTGGTLHFVCSGGKHGTRAIATKLAELLKEAPEEKSLSQDYKYQFYEVDERDAQSITTKTDVLIAPLSNSERIGLNYTGGTKVMAVHVYRAVERAAQQSNLNVQYSYLDASTLSFRLHDANGTQTEVIRADSLFVLPLIRLLRMHQIRLDEKSPPHTNPIALPLATALAQLHTTSAGAELWFSLRREKSANWTKLPPHEPALAQVEAAWREMCGGNDPNPKGVARALGFDELRSCADYFKGKWLEDYTLGQIQDVMRNRTDCQDAQAGLKCIRTLGDKETDNFDLDMVMMRGYQLFALSCMSSNRKKECKEHLLEVLVRARQTGGEEARIGFVCLIDNSQQLQVEIENAWDADGKVKVFGMQDLPALKAKIDDWLNEQTRQQEKEVR